MDRANIWQVEDSINTTNVVFNQSILRLNFILFSTTTCSGPHGTIIRQYYDRSAEVIELLNMDPYFNSHPVGMQTCLKVQLTFQILCI
jgi:hypothetical protein